MKKLKVLSALSLLAVAGAANAEISGSMGIATSYLWRGIDLGKGGGVPAISGDLHYSNSGFYAGIWGSSGDHVAGTEYDLYAGWGGSAGPVTMDFSYWTYSYPTATNVTGDPFSGPAKGSRPGNLSELVTSVGVGPVSAFLLYNINAPGLFVKNDLTTEAANGHYMYYGLKAKAGAFSAVLGHHNDPTSGYVPANAGVYLTHFDISYAYNDNLTFTVSAPLRVSDKIDGNTGERYHKPDPTFVASYSVPFGK